MLPHLSRLSFWLAGLTAAASLLLPGPQGGTLASIAMLALLAALWLRRFKRPSPEASLPETSGLPSYDDVAMMEFAALAARHIDHADGLKAAVAAIGGLMVRELGAAGVRVHELPGSALPSPVDEAVRTGAVVLLEGNGFALPITREGRVAIVLYVRRIELAVVPASFARLLEVVRAQLDGAAARAPKTEDAEPAPDAPPAFEGNVLFVEDNRIHREVLGPIDDCLSEPFRQGPLIAMPTLRPARTAVPSMSDTGRQSGGMASPMLDEVLDAASLARLRELDPKNETQLLARVAKAFETSAARYVPQLTTALRKGDTRDLGLVAHTLKSSSSAIGALKLSRQCAEIESMIKAGQSEGLGPRVDAVCTEIGIVLQALKRLLDGTS